MNRFHVFIKPFFITALLLFSAPAFAEETHKTKAFFNCYLTNGVLCEDLEKRYFLSDSRVAPASEKDSDVIITVRVLVLSSGQDQMQITYTSKRGLFKEYVLDGELFQIRSTLPIEAKLEGFLKHIIAGASPVHQLSDYRRDPEGHMLLSFKAKEGAVISSAASPEQPWYFILGGGLNISASDARVISGSAGLGGGYTDSEWFGGAGADIHYHHVKVEEQGQTHSADNARIFGGAQIGRSLSEHWSVALIVRGTHDPSANWKSRMQAHAGIEYELVPFLTDNGNTLTVSYLIGANHERFFHENIEGDLEKVFATHAMSINFVKVFENVQFNVAAGVASLVNRPRQFAVGGNAGVVFYVTRTLSFQVQGNVGYKRNIVNAPRDENAIDPFLSAIGAGGNVAPLTYSVTFGVKYSLGNTVREQKDVRWNLSPTSLPINF
ncbi:MAG: hypothetical protein AB1540_14630 [Bdellovibrionota bacterium]